MASTYHIVCIIQLVARYSGLDNDGMHFPFVFLIGYALVSKERVSIGILIREVKRNSDQGEYEEKQI